MLRIFHQGLLVGIFLQEEGGIRDYGATRELHQLPHQHSQDDGDIRGNTDEKLVFQSLEASGSYLEKTCTSLLIFLYFHNSKMPRHDDQYELEEHNPSYRFHEQSPPRDLQESQLP